jgi:hypothetical protein
MRAFMVTGPNVRRLVIEKFSDEMKLPMEPLYTESELRAALEAKMLKSELLLEQLDEVRREIQLILKRLQVVAKKPEGVILPLEPDEKP